MYSRSWIRLMEFTLCLLKLLARDNAQSHLLHLFSDVSSKHMHGKLQSHTGCIQLTLPHFAFQNVSSNRLPQRLQSYIGCICLAFSPLCVFRCILRTSSQEDAQSRWLHFLTFSPLCVFECLFKLPACEDAKSHWLHLIEFSPVCVFKCVLKWHA